jgi:hypothetical protein
MRSWLLALFVPFAAHGQVVLSTLSGTTETPIASSSFNFGSIAPLMTEDVTFRARGTGSAAVTITQLALSGIGFAIVNTSTLPYTIAPGNTFDFTVRFTGGPVGSYSANLQVNTVIVALQGMVTEAATVATSASDASRRRSRSVARSRSRIPIRRRSRCRRSCSRALPFKRRNLPQRPFRLDNPSLLRSSSTRRPRLRFPAP